MATEFTPLAASVGGILIGLSASVLLLTQGRIAGISGIFGGLFDPRPGDVGWRVAFLVGMFAAGIGAVGFFPSAFESGLTRSPAAIALAGLLVGFGTRLGNGCTSGHGVCGLSRLSRRSMVSVATFMFSGAVAAFVVNHLLGGA